MGTLAANVTTVGKPDTLEEAYLAALGRISKFSDPASQDAQDTTAEFANLYSKVPLLKNVPAVAAFSTLHKFAHWGASLQAPYKMYQSWIEGGPGHGSVSKFCLLLLCHSVSNNFGA